MRFCWPSFFQCYWPWSVRRERSTYFWLQKCSQVKCSWIVSWLPVRSCEPWQVGKVVCSLEDLNGWVFRQRRFLPLLRRALWPERRVRVAQTVGGLKLPQDSGCPCRIRSCNVSMLDKSGRESGEKYWFCLTWPTTDCWPCWGRGFFPGTSSPIRAP